MIRALVVVAIAIASASGGYYLGQNRDQKHWDFTTPFDEHKDVPWLPVANGSSVACKALADAFLFEDRVGERTVKIKAGAGTDTAAIKVAPDGNSVSWLNAANVRAGATEGSLLPVLARNGDILLAGKFEWPNVSVVMLDLKSGNAVWSNTGWLVGLSGQTLYMECK